MTAKRTLPAKRTNGRRRDRAAYERRKADANARNRKLAAAGREIGRLPKVRNPARRVACQFDLRLFAETYHAATFCLQWSPDHLDVIGALQTAVLQGGQSAIAMPRGSGKTSLSIAACEWALLFGHRRFLLLIAATEAAATQLLELIRQDLQTAGTPLAEDFPEVVAPILALDGIGNRAAGQLHQGERTKITLTDSEIVLPTIAGSAASGAILRVAGLLGRIRGAIARLPDGSTARPDLVIVDDPQTDESAQSLSQCAQRERVLSGTVLGLAGPGKQIAAVATVTVIRAGDVADRLLDRQAHPEWHGRRTKLLYVEPANEKAWQAYADVRSDSLREHGDIRDATAYYLEHRAELDEGARVAWEQRFNPQEASAIQHAMNLKLQDPAAFAAEYQNEPLTDRAGGDDGVGLLTLEEIARRVNGYPEGELPAGTIKLTGSIDVQQRLLYWLVAAWGEDFTGTVVSYGAFPKQATDHFLYAHARPTLQDLSPNAGMEGSIQAGLQQLTDTLCGMTWTTEDGTPMQIARLLIDANWRQSTELVYGLCRRSRFGLQLMPSHGSFFGLAKKPLSDWAKKPGDRSGYGWRIPVDSRPRHVKFDAGLWKSHVHARLATSPGDSGSLTLFGKSPTRHRMLAEQLTAETRERMRGTERVVDVWTLQPNRDNHLLDCLVGAAVAASVEGICLPGVGPVRRPAPRAVPAPAKKPRAARYPSFGARP